MITHPRRTESDPAYRVVANELRVAILRDSFKDSGGQLPTEAELSEQYKVSRQTIRRAFVDLVAEGMVYRVPGRGTFVAERDRRYVRQFGSIDDLLNLSMDTKIRIVQPLRRGIDVTAAGRLRLDSDDVYSLSFIRFHDEVPIGHTMVYLAPRVGSLLEQAPELPLDSLGTIIGLINTVSQSPVTEADQSITAVPAGADIARMLGCPQGAPMLRIDRLYFDSDARPVELAESQFLPERYSYRVRLRRSLP